MITYLTHIEIDSFLWDDCIEHSLNGNAYASTRYLDVVHPGWDALVERDEAGFGYLTVMPITKKRKFGINYLCQPFFAQQLGVFSRRPLSQQHIVEFLQAIPRKYRLVEIRLNEGNPLDESIKGVEHHQNYLLDLNRSYEEISADYHENTCRNLKKSLKNKLTLTYCCHFFEVIDLFRADRGAKVKHWGDQEYQRLEYLAFSQNAISWGLSRTSVCGVKIDGNQNIICGAIFLETSNRITFLFSGNSALGKETQAMTFLIDQVIQKYAGQPMTFDFEGSDDPNLARFYQGFGSHPVTYPSFSYRIFNPLR